MRFPAPIAAPLLIAGLACAAGQSRAATLNVAVNHSLRLPVAGRAASVVVGNAAVADVTVIDSHTLFVTGKSAGTTDVAVVDPLGRTVFAADVAVGLGGGRAVTVHRASETAELSCDPRCVAPVKDGALAAPSSTAGAATAAASLSAGPLAPVLGAAVGAPPLGAAAMRFPPVG